MRLNLSHLLLVLALTATLPATVAAQEYVAAPVEISKETVKRDGKLYYAHVVQEKQTLFSIAKVYGVTLNDIYEANAATNLKEEGLKKNSIILIPKVDSAQPSATPAPAATTPPSAAPEPKEEEYTLHTVRWYENIDDIAAKYGVTADQIQQYNALPSRKLKIRQKIRIPKAGAKMPAAPAATVTEKPAEPVTETVAKETAAEPSQTASQKESGWIDWSIFSKKTKVNAALVLPMLRGGKPVESYMDFYCGVLLAVRDLGLEGISTELSVYDMAGGKAPVTVERLKESDLVIGPVSKADVTTLLQLDSPGTPVISPLDQKVSTLVESNASLIQAPASHYAQYVNLVEWMDEERHSGDKVVVISEKGATASTASSTIKNALAARNIPFTPFTYSILEGRNISGSLSGTLSGSGVNRIIVATESEAFANDVVRNLNLLGHNRFNIVMYAPSRIRSFETVDVESLHNLSLHVCAAYYIDYSDQRVKDFLLEYRALYKTEPTQYAFQGYDIAYFFIKNCQKNGNGWLRSLDKEKGQMLQSDFLMVRNGLGGYINHAVRRIVYEPDYSVKLVR